VPLRRGSATGGSRQRASPPEADARSAATAAGQGTAPRALHDGRNAKYLTAPLSSVGRWLKAMGFGPLRKLLHKEPVQQYQWAQPGDMIHVDTKQHVRFERVGHRITGDRREGCSPEGCRDKAQVGDITRLAYVEVLPDEQKAMTVGCLVWAVSWFTSQKHNLPRGSLRRRQSLRLQAVAAGLHGSGPESQTHQGLHAADQLQKRVICLAEGFCKAIEATGGVGICDAVHRLRGAQALVAALLGDL